MELFQAREGTEAGQSAEGLCVVAAVGHDAAIPMQLQLLEAAELKQRLQAQWPGWTQAHALVNHQALQGWARKDDAAEVANCQTLQEATAVAIICYQTANTRDGQNEHICNNCTMMVTLLSTLCIMRERLTMLVSLLMSSSTTFASRLDALVKNRETAPTLFVFTNTLSWRSSASLGNPLSKLWLLVSAGRMPSARSTSIRPMHGRMASRVLLLLQ